MADSSRRNNELTEACCQDYGVQGDGETTSQSLSSLNIVEGMSRLGKPLLVAANGETCFSHLTCARTYCSHLERFQRHAVVSMELKITQECLKRYVCAVNFAKKLKTSAEHEMKRLNSIHRHGRTNKGFSLEYYHNLCKEALAHFSHWENLERKAKRQAQSFTHGLSVLRRIECFKGWFLSLKRQNLYWLRQIALTGLRAMANASFKQLSSTADLQNFLQGMEEFNHLLSFCLRCCAQQQSFYEAPDRRECLKFFFNRSLHSLNIVEILATVCVERAPILARLTHDHFIKEAKAIELQDFLSITRFSWSFDSHLSTSDLLECTANEGYGKLQAVIRKYVQKDEEFIKQLVNTASVCAYLHHENERKKLGSPCEQHLQLANCECNSTLKCRTCQENDNSVKAITDGSEYGVEHWEPPENISAVSDVSHNRRSLFMESNETNLKLQLCSVYSADLWERFALQFSNRLQSLRWPYVKDSPIGPVCCWSTAVLIGITQHLDNFASSGPFSEIGAQSVRVVNRSLYLNSVLANLDSLHCLIIAVGQTDKCKSTGIVNGIPSTKTTSLMVQACSVFQHFFSTASHWKVLQLEDTSLSSSSSSTLRLRVEDVFDRFSAFLDCCVFWFTTKSKHFLAGWNLLGFLVVSQYELGILMKSVNTTLQLMEGLSCQKTSISGSVADLRQLWDTMERKAGYLQVIETQSWEDFKHKLITMASDFWCEMMPKGRIWKRSRNSGNLPSEPSSYVEHAIVHVLQPIIEGVRQLPLGLQNYIVVQTVEITMDTWSSHILKEEIKFSVIGAYQLQVDFNYVKLWLTSETSTLNSSIQSDLAILDVFNQLNEAVHLLMIQPKKRKKMSKPTMNGVEQDMTSNSSTISGSSVLSTNSSYDGELELLSHRLIPNKEQWLNLRLRKGKPSFPLVIPACLRSAEQI